ncbi:uncharacterized protein PGTG_00924 [Puccinia graminis f. sp. tritici CRL 75-36-700-3]|uniref:Uncharacterized protein n=1 Tax=Puccinia graminis f. sp. tritici (strain CRL 75-36-700-3 / race SCCL) TaxID=418459 RepID=E3JU68_PUCGT|nr:uncharacterized protein PGTG_00924 [Puccinia graminis f. sp. tritici CRL 75-36-700-3]EFP75593.2 hypothetical protein PGTG_00924 [Puccinia graminis f. sp. tritici CRL 75-36-700-3]
MVLPLKALSCILALPSLIGASSPGADPPPTGCLHSNRIPETKSIPCPATYTCHSGYSHPCPNWLRSRSLRCDNCGDVKLDYTEACERAPHGKSPCYYTTAGTGQHQGWDREPRLTQPTQYGPDEQANDVGRLSPPEMIVSLTSSQATVRHTQPANEGLFEGASQHRRLVEPLSNVGLSRLDQGW